MKRLFRRRSRATSPLSRRIPLSLELLEDRLVPATYNVIGLADGLGAVTMTSPGVFNAPSLRSAIQAANASAGGNTINLTLPGVYPITLHGTAGETDNTAGEFAIQPTGGDLTIQNTSGGKVTVDAGGQSRVFDINPNFDAANPTTAFKVTFQGFTIENGSVTDAANPDGPNASGGGIRDQGNASLTLNNVVVTNNTATADGGGVAMENVASVPWTLTVNNSTVSGNHAGDAGGGLETDGSGKIFVNGSTITGNTSVNQGAGIWLDAIQVGTVFQGANLTVTGTLLTNNTAVAPNNAGGGIGNAGNGTVTIQSSTLANNYSGQFGGGFGDQNAQGTLVVVDSTFVDNVSVANGGGIEAAGPSTTIADSTIAGNVTQAQGGGVAVTSAAFTLNNSVVAGNLSNNANGMNFQGTAPDIAAAVTTGNGDFIGIGDTNLTGITTGSHGNHIGTTAAPLFALLGPLQSNGGPTPTEAPLAGSPLIDAGVNGVVPTGITLDQRGFLRTVNTTVDIGAVEFQPPANTTMLVVAPTAAAFGQAVTFTATVLPQTPGSNTPQGTVTFIVDGTPQAPVPLTNGVATLSLSTLAAGSHTIGATFSGDSNFVSTTATPQPLTITAPVVVANFGNTGVWEFNRVTNAWVQLTPANASHLAADPMGDIAAVFPGFGVQLYRPGVGWKQIHPYDASLLAIDARGDVFAEFPGFGVGEYQVASGWRTLTPANATVLAVDPQGDVAAVFPGYGVQLYQPAVGWRKLNGVDATLLAIDGNGDVVANFPGYGVGEYLPATGWQTINGANATALAVNAAGEVVASFGADGVGVYLPSFGWRQLLPADAGLLAIDFNGDVYGEFAGFGLWEFDPSQFGHQLRETDATLLAVA
jgi:hypothetical protein